MSNFETSDSLHACSDSEMGLSVIEFQEVWFGMWSLCVCFTVGEDCFEYGEEAISLYMALSIGLWSLDGNTNVHLCTLMDSFPNSTF